MDDARLFLCARCRRQVLICSRCDRGQRYCGARCSGPARRESLRAAGRRYQQTRRGRHCHAERQRRYLNYGNRYADLLFEVVTRRYLTVPILLTTNKPFSEWADVFSSAACVVTLVDRIRH